MNEWVVGWCCFVDDLSLIELMWWFCLSIVIVCLFICYQCFVRLLPLYLRVIIGILFILQIQPQRKKKNRKIKWPRFAKIKINKKKLYVCCKFIKNVLVLLVFVCLLYATLLPIRCEKIFLLSVGKYIIFFFF